MTPHLCIKDAHKPREHASWNSYPISDQNLWFSPPYFRPEALEPGAWPERVTICYGQTPVVGVNIKREMVLSPNGEEVALAWIAGARKNERTRRRHGRVEGVPARKANENHLLPPI